MTVTVDPTPLAHPRETSGAKPELPPTPQMPLRLLQTARRPAVVSRAPPRQRIDWLARMAVWLRATL